MMTTPTHRTLSGFARECAREEGVAIESLDPETTLVVTTRNSAYRLVVVDGASHRVRMEGGARFREAVPALLGGACAGGSMVKTGWIVPGLRMELLVGSRWISTSQVLSVAIDQTGV